VVNGHTYIEFPAETKDKALWLDRTGLLATAKKLHGWSQKHSSFQQKGPLELQLTETSWGLARRNYKFRGKCETGGLKAETWKTTRDLHSDLQIPISYCGNKPRLYSRVKSRTELPSTGLKDSDVKEKK
jgi:hypothetical protein